MLAMFAMLAGLPVYTAVGRRPGRTLPARLLLRRRRRQRLANQPRMLAAQLRARSSAERVREARAGYLPTVAFNATGVRVADTGTSTAAGNITTSAISDRFAYGGNLAQLVTDFGRTSALVRSARATAEAQADVATLTRAQVRLNVREAYYQVLGAEAVLRAARAALENRALVSRQLSALAESELKVDSRCKLCECVAKRGRIRCGSRRECRRATTLPFGNSNGLTGPGERDSSRCSSDNRRSASCPRPPPCTRSESACRSQCSRSLNRRGLVRPPIE